MDVTVFSTRSHDRQFLDVAVDGRHALRYLDVRLTARTAPLAKGSRAVCVFVDDQVDAAVLATFERLGVGLVALRASACDNVDLVAAERAGIAIARVPAYSPEAVAEHTVALMLSLDRTIRSADARGRGLVLDGPPGFRLHGKTVGVVGTGRIGAAVSRIVAGFGCEVIAYDVVPNLSCQGAGVDYVSLNELFARSDIVTLHCPLTAETRHLVDTAGIAGMKRGVMLINTSRSGLVDTQALIDGIERGAIGHLALDVYEEEASLFFDGLSDRVIRDDVFERLLTLPHVLATGPEALSTSEALTAMAETTVANVDACEKLGRPLHEVVAEPDRAPPRATLGLRSRGLETVDPV